jgi:hypothetical protein
MSLGAGQLFPAERVLWSGAPVRFPLFDVRDVVFWPLGVLSGLAAVYDEIAMAQATSTQFVLAWRCLFALVGLYLVVGRVAWRQFLTRSAQYTVTNRRIIVDANVLGRKMNHSRYLSELGEPTCREGRNGIGTIRFSFSERLVGIRGVRAVCALISEAQLRQRT